MSLAALIAAAAASQACAPLATDARTYSQVQYPNFEQRLSLWRSGGRWAAKVGDQVLPARDQHGALNLTLAGGGGRFEGNRKGAKISGFWIEPKTRFDHARALRMTLDPDGRGWSGVIGINEDRVTLNAWLLEDAGKPQFLVRNPDGLVGDTRFTATPSGCGFALTDLNDQSHHARLSFASGRARLDGLTDNLPNVALTVTPADAAAPAHTGVDTAAAAAEGLDPAPIRALIDMVAANDPTVRGAPLIHSILVARHGRLIAERYFAGYSAERLHETRSLSKSFTPLLVGAARAHHIPVSANTTLDEALPQYRAIFAADPRKGRITLGDLLGMRSGLACDDFDDASPGGEDRMQAQTGEPDWYRYFLSLPVVHPPGEHYAYCSAGTHLAAGVVASVAHRSVLDLFDRWVATPLGITDYSLPLDPKGRVYFGGGAHMRPRDLVRIGELVLDDGRWKGRQIVDRDWLKKSTSCPASQAQCDEGLGWHFNRLEANGRTYREIEANGNGGQLLMIFPELDMVVVFTAANFNAYPVWRKFREELTPQYILSAVRR